MTATAATARPVVVADRDFAPETEANIPVDRILPHPGNRRIGGFSTEGIKQLADSIRKGGLLQAVTVRPHPAKPGHYELVAGERRWRAHRELKRATIRGIVRDVDDETLLRLQTIENLQREDVHPLDEADGYARLLALTDKDGKAKLDVLAIANEIGKSESYVYQRLKLLALTPACRKALIDGELTAGHAIELARLQPKDQAEGLTYSRGSNYRGVRSVRELRNWIEESIHLDLHAAPWKKDDATLVAAAGACTTCPKRTGYQPALFADIAKKDTCTDRACYHLKQRAYLARRAEEIKKEHGSVVYLTESYSPTSGLKVLVQGQWKAAAKGSCKHVEVGVVAEGRGLGQLKYFCRGADCRTHRESWQIRRRTEDSRHSASQRRQQLLQRSKTLGRRRAFDAIVAKAPAQLGPWDLRFVARMLSKEMHHDALKSLCDLKGWQPKKTSWGGKDYAAAIRSHIDSANGPQLARILYELILAPDLHVAQYSSSTGERIREAGQHFQVRVAQLERAAAAELRKKAKVQTSAKKKARAKKARAK